MPQLARKIQSCKGATCPKGKRQEQFSIEGVPNLYLWVAEGGNKTWSVRFKKRIDGKQKSYSIPLGPFTDRDDGTGLTLKQAAIECGKAMLSVKQDLNPVTEANKNIYTVKEMSEDWQRRHVSTLKSETQAHYKILLDSRIIPAIGTRPVDSIKKFDVVRIGDLIADEGKGRMADATVNCMSAMFGWHAKRNDTFTNPARDVPRYNDAKKGDAGRALDDHEIHTLWHGLEGIRIGRRIILACRLMLLTGQRVSQICGAAISEYEEIDGAPAWTIPGTRTGTKNGQPITVPLAPMALEVWNEALTTFASKTHLFPPQRPAGNLHMGRSVCLNALVKLHKAKGGEPINNHDFRRTVRTHMARLRIPREISARCLGHAHGGVRGSHDEVYNRYEYLSEKREAFETWEAELARIVT